MNALTPWTRTRSPWKDLESLQERVNRVFNLNLPAFTLEEPVAWLPPVNPKEVDGEFLLSAELPGMELDDIELDVDKDCLTIRGEKRTEREEKEEGRWHLMERSHGSFERSFTLPRAVEAEKIEAEFADGILTVHMPKRKEAMGRKIDIAKK